MGLWSRFKRRHSAGETVVSAGAVTREPGPEKAPTPEQLAELQDAWAELADAAKGSGVKSFHACGRSGKPWQEDPAAVRSMSAMLRGLKEENTAAELGPAK